MREAARLGARRSFASKSSSTRRTSANPQKCVNGSIWPSPLPGPTTAAHAGVWVEGASTIVLIVPIFEGSRRRGVYRNSAAIVDADGSLMGVYRKMHIPDDPLYCEKYYFTPGDAAHGRPHRRDRSRLAAQATPGFKRVANTLREHRRAGLLGSVVSGSGAHHRAGWRGHPVLSHSESAGIRRRKTEFGAAQVDVRGARCSARTCDRERRVRRVAQPRRARGRRAGYATASSSSSDIRSSPIRSAGSSPTPALIRGDSDREVRPGSSSRTTRRNWPFLRDLEAGSTRTRRSSAVISARDVRGPDPPRSSMCRTGLLPAEWERHTAPRGSRGRTT